MKYPILASITALLIIMSARSAAAQERLVDAKLTGVTVFRSSAREEQTVQTNLGSGQSEIIISDIPVSMNEKSLQVSVLGETDLISAQVRTNYIPDGNTAEQKTSTAIWLDSLRMLERRHRWIVEEKSVLQNELNLLDRLFAQVDASSGYSPSNVRESVSFYGSHSLDVRKKMFDLQLMEEELNDRRALLQQQMEENGEIKTRAVKEIILRFVSVKSVSIDLTVSYLVQAAGWLPFYDVRVKDTSSPVNLSAKARIFQSTGYDWQDVPVKISTMQPGIDNNRPLMSPAYIDYVTYRFNRVDNNSQFGVTNMMQVEHVDAKIKLTEKTDVPTTTLPDFSFDPGESDVMDEYNLKRLMTIRSDGKENIAELKEYTLPATYRYHSVPKLDASVFLIARITEFGPLNLLAGDANVFFDTKYIGQVQFNPRTIQDTLLVSLGRDDRILVKRVRTDAHVGKKLLSDKEEETFTYKTTVRNNKKEPIEIEILDQIPLSRKDEIKVEMISRDKAEYNKTFGKLMWTMKIDPGKSKSVEFSYSVQSPEGKPVEEIR